MKKKSFLKFRFIKKYEVDLWGYLTTCSNGKKHFLTKMLKVFCFNYKYKIKWIRHYYKKTYIPFIYSTSIPKKKRRVIYNKSHIKGLHYLLKFRTYYGNMTIRKFRKYLQRVNKRRIDFISKITFLLESRLDILLCRLNFVRNPREARKYIKLKKIKVNDKIVNHLNHQVYINDVIYMDHDLMLKFLKTLRYNLRKKKILFNYPRYLEVNYKLMKCIFISFPKKKDIPSICKLKFSFLRNLF